MSDFIPKANTGKVGGLSRAAQKLAAAKGKDSFAKTKKVPFQRKAV